MEFISKSEKETQKIAKKILEKTLEQDTPKVLALYGELGAGKTTFTKAIAKNLGIEEEVHSPTFLLIREYILPSNHKGVEKLIHADAYRIDDPTELSDMGIEKSMGHKNSLVVIEWAERVEKLIPKNATRIKFEVMGETERKISLP